MTQYTTAAMDGRVDPSAILGGALSGAGVDRVAEQIMQSGNGGFAGRLDDSSFRTGMVTASDPATWTVTATVTGSTTAVASIPVIDAALPAAGDVVVLAKFGPNYVCMGSYQAASRTGVLMAPVELRSTSTLTVGPAVFTLQAVPGCSYNLVVKSLQDVFEVECMWDMTTNAGTGNVVHVGGLLVDGAANPGQAVLQAPTGGRTTTGSTYLLKNLTPGTHTLVLGYYCPSASPASGSVLTPHTGMVIKQLPTRAGDTAVVPARFVCTVRQTTAQSVGQAVYTPDWTFLNFGTQEEGSSGWSGADPSKVFLPAAGNYAFSAGWANSWATGTALDSILGVRLYNADGSIAQTSLVEDRVGRPYSGSATVSGSVKTTAPGMYLRVYVFHDPGGTLNTVPGNCFLSVRQTT